MKKPKAEVPKVADPIPVPQPDDPTLIETRRSVRQAASNRQGSANSLLTPGGAKGVASGGGTKRRRLGYGAL